MVQIEVVQLTSGMMLMMKMVLLQLLFLLFVSTPQLTALPNIFTNFTDQEALISFKKHVTSDPNMVLSNWNQSVTPSFCNWNGISCSKRRQRVTSISLPDNLLRGTITPHIANLSFLRLLNLSNNMFYGSLPPEIGRLRRLTILMLGSNRIEGKIPPSLGDCHKIRNLSLSSNLFQGSIPYQLGFLPHMIRLRLTNNFLTGTIPSSLGNLSGLVYLSLANNFLQGRIPDVLARLFRLQVLDFTLNDLGGLLPYYLFNFSSLTILGLGHNMLHGQLPTEMALPDLEFLIMGRNRLSGPIPVSLFNDSKHLKHLELSRNSFHGPIPTSIASKLPLIQKLNLENNSLVNEPEAKELSILTSLANCRFLEVVELGLNPLGGVLPKSVGNLSTHLTELSIFGSQIEGNIPADIGNLSSLTILELRGNSLSGRIPSEIGKLRQLQRLFLNDNRLGGTIPYQLGFLESLGELFLEQNTLSGPIPDFIKNLTVLQKLHLDSNRFLGQIPVGAWRSQTLWQLNLSSNSLNGFLPPELGDLESLVSFAVSENHISGEIPKTLGNLVMIIDLDLSRNLFQGLIPSTFSNLKSIEFLDISSNNMSGLIPMSLESLPELKFLNLSFNKLEGSIPNGGVFVNLTVQSVMGNLKLCGGGLKLELPICLTDDNPGHPAGISPVKKIIILASTTVGFSVFCYLSFRFYWKKKLATDLSDDSLSLQVGNRRISHRELCLATDNFSKANLLGIGSVGSVYRGILSDGTIIAIKVLNLQLQRSVKNFNTECKILSRVRHRNLVKIVTICSNLEFKALVLQFMANGSLDEWIYPRNCDGRDRGLSLLQRLDIMIDVAKGMEYLHHGYSRSIVHCDLKPSNVLLDEDMVAHIGDFGISQMKMENQSITPKCTIGTIGYIAPEFGLSGRSSIKGDVYSYGILVLETFTKKRPTDSMFTGDLSLSKWVEASIPYNFTEILDQELWKEDIVNNGRETQESKLNCCLSIMKMGLSCAKESAELRIDMREVVSELKDIRKKFVDSLWITNH